MNPFWSNFWSNFLANLAVVAAITIGGFLAKARIARGFKKYFSNELLGPFMEAQQEHEFTPRPGQVDFTHARVAPVVNCVVQHNGKILIVQRSKSMHFYPGLWNGISGFLDDGKTVEEKAREEVVEELGLESSNINSIKIGEVFSQDEPEYHKTWIVHPVLVDISTNRVTTDWEAQDHKWIIPGDLSAFQCMPKFDEVVKRALSA